MYRTDFWTLWEKARVGCFKRTALKHVYYLGWNQITSPGRMHETSAWTCCTGKTQRDQVEREEGGRIGIGNTCKSMAESFHCMTNPLQYCKVISLQLIKKKKKENYLPPKMFIFLESTLSRELPHTLFTIKSILKKKKSLLFIKVHS